MGISTKFDIIYLLEAIDANPNGDPDQEGAPRQDPDSGHGLMSPGAINRKLRNYVGVARGDQPPFRIQIRRGNKSIERTILDVAELDDELKELIPTGPKRRRRRARGRPRPRGRARRGRPSSPTTRPSVSRTSCARPTGMSGCSEA